MSVVWLVFMLSLRRLFFFFFLNDPAPTEFYPFPLPAPLPFCPQVGADGRPRAAHPERAGDVDGSSNSHRGRANRRRRHPWRRGEGRLDLGSGCSGGTELPAEARFIPPPLIFLLFSFGGLVLILAPFLVCLHLIAVQKAAQTVLEPV